MAFIDEIIPQQGFEIVLNRLGAILLEELTNQKTIQGFDYSFEIFEERSHPYDKGEDVMINVSCNNASYANQNQAGSQGDTAYYIDVYTNGTESDIATGDEDATDKQNKFLGMIRYILSHTKYKTLLFPAPLIGGCYVQQFQKDDTYGAQDGSYNKMARITLSVRINETQALLETNSFSGMDTTIKLSSTDKGYKLIFNT